MRTNILSPSTFYRIHTAAEIYKAVYMWAVLLLPIMSVLLAVLQPPSWRKPRKQKRHPAADCATERRFQEERAQGWKVTAS